MMINDNLQAVRQRIADACKRRLRDPAGVRLVCVIKEVGLAEAEELLRLGARELGENRVQELAAKYGPIGDRAVWHLIGHLQTNKAKEAVKIASLIHSVDSERLAREIDKEARKLNKVQDILVQVNVSGEESKFGISPEELSALIKNIELYPNINIMGLMTMAPETADPEEARPHFRRLRDLRDGLVLGMIASAPSAPRNDGGFGKLVLSMGMSNDFEVAIEEGADIIRVGRAIFK